MRKWILALLLPAVIISALTPAAGAAEAAVADSSSPVSGAAEYEAAAAARRQEILSSGTEIVKSDVFIPGETYTGQAYYVSFSTGSDGNSGTSPDSPWQTVWQVINADLRPGDAVFFRRGICGGSSCTRPYRA